jgi:TatA/E family protein of Tat protein translocase
MLTGHLPELLIVLTLALVIFGPKRIPEIGSSLGQGIRDFKGDRFRSFWEASSTSYSRSASWSVASWTGRCPPVRYRGSRAKLSERSGDDLTRLSTPW